MGDQILPLASTLRSEDCTQVRLAEKNFAMTDEIETLSAPVACPSTTEITFLSIRFSFQNKNPFYA